MTYISVLLVNVFSFSGHNSADSNKIDLTLNIVERKSGGGISAGGGISSGYVYKKCDI